MAKLQFNRPPTWPPMPAEWHVQPGWVPDETWPPVPPGWQLWVKRSGPPVWAVVVGVLAVVAVTIAAALLLGSRATARARAVPVTGSCLRLPTGPDGPAVTTGCDDRHATWVVTSRHDDTLDVVSSCEDDARATSGRSFTADHGVEHVLCLAGR